MANPSNIILFDLFILCMTIPISLYKNKIRNRLVLICFSIHLICTFIFTLEILAYGKPAALYAFYFLIYPEPIGILFSNTLAVLSLVAIIYILQYSEEMEPNIEKRNSFLFYINCSILVTNILMLSGNLITLFTAYEILTLLTLPLVNHSRSVESIKALRFYFFLLSLPSILLFIPAIIYLNSILPTIGLLTTNFINLEYDLLSGISIGSITYVVLAIFFGLSKSAIFPMHMWLQKAMIAPYPVSALLHSVAVVNVGLVSVFKIGYYLFKPDYFQPNHYIKFISYLILFGATYTSFRALMATNIKKLLAYSTVSQLNNIVFGILNFKKNLFYSSLILSVVHSFSKMTLFLTIANNHKITKSNALEKFKNIAYVDKINSVAFLLASLSLTGIPFLPGFYPKILSLQALEPGSLIFYVSNCNTILTSAYLMKLILTLFGKVGRNEDILSNNKSKFSLELTVGLFITMLCLCICALLVLPQLIISNFEEKASKACLVVIGGILAKIVLVYEEKYQFVTLENKIQLNIFRIFDYIKSMMMKLFYIVSKLLEDIINKNIINLICCITLILLGIFSRP